MILLKNATIVSADKEGIGSILIDGEKIKKVFWHNDGPQSPENNGPQNEDLPEGTEVIDLTGKHIIAGGIDAHVHFREPGLTHKADISTESRAAVAGGVTTVFDMPNTNPATTSTQALAEKIELAKGKSLAKIAFHIGATNSNAEEICRLIEEGDAATGLKESDVPGIKIFMGSSTGNMLVNDQETLPQLFNITSKPILVHCEDEQTIKLQLEAAIEKYGDNIPFEEHENIRSRLACIRSCIKALEYATMFESKLTVCHISTKEEINMVNAAKAYNKDITAETSCNYLWFTNADYARLGSKVKCNPSVKTAEDRQALREALRDGQIDTIGSDHAPHLLSEKDAPYAKAPSGLPTIQQSLPVLLTVAKQEDIPLTRIASVFSEKASEIYALDRGKIKAGMKADLVVFDYDKTFTVKAEDQYSKCGWTPYEGEVLNGCIETVYIDGKKVLENGRII